MTTVFDVAKKKRKKPTTTRRKTHVPRNASYWAYTMEDLAKLFGVKVEAMKKRVSRTGFDPTLINVCRLWAEHNKAALMAKWLAENSKVPGSIPPPPNELT